MTMDAEGEQTPDEVEEEEELDLETDAEEEEENVGFKDNDGGAVRGRR
jgi:hypothetical protein